MFGLTSLLQRIRPVFTPLEKRLLHEVKSKLSPQAADLFTRQLESINLVQRHQRSREVCAYPMRGSKPYHDPLLQFPATSLELILARATFACLGQEDSWSAEFFLVRGYFFSIVFNRSPQPIRYRDDVVVEKLEILHDPMVASAPLIKRPSTASPTLHALLGELASQHELLDVYEPLAPEARAEILKDIEMILPVDYLRLAENTEGFRLGEWTVFGVSEIYGISLPQDDYYVLAERHERGVLAVAKSSRDQRLYFCPYDGSAPVDMGTSFRFALSSERPRGRFTEAAT